MLVLGYDPGTDVQALVLTQVRTKPLGRSVSVLHRFSGSMNETLNELTMIHAKYRHEEAFGITLVVEWMLARGTQKANQDDLYLCCVQAGRVIQRWVDLTSEAQWTKITRNEVKKRLLGSVVCGDSEIQQFLRFMFDEPANNRIKPTGQLKGFKFHEWAALAVAVAYGKNI